MASQGSRPVSSFRRWYFYVVSAVSLQAVTWAVIALLRNLLAPALGLADRTLSPEAERIAFQISVIIIGLPMFLLHWQWARKPYADDASDKQAPVERALYLYFMIGAFLIPLVANANGFIQSLLRLAGGMPALRPFFSDALPDRANLAYTGTAVFVLALMLAFHTRLLRQDRRSQPITAIEAEIHRLFIYLFSAVGLIMTSYAAANLLQWLLLAAGDKPDLAVSRQLTNGIAAMISGLPLWLFFWSRAQQLFRSGRTAEQNSLLRKAYLYFTIFLSVLATISAATALLAGLLRRLLGLEAQEGSGVVISALITGAAVWAYHTLVLREDTRQVPLLEEQAGLRRLYWYLVAGVGLLVLLIGLGGVLGVLFDPGQYIISRQREQLAWFAAMLVAGLVVWIVPWRQIQKETAGPMPQGTAARTSIVRRFYLFFFLLLATLTFLIAAVFVLSRLLIALLGEALSPEDLRMMGLSAAYAIMAGAVWLYHGRLLRQDQQMLDAQQAQRAATMRIVVVDDGDGSLGLRLLDSLHAALPGSEIVPAGLTESAATAMHSDNEAQDLERILAEADIIVGPWSMAAPRAGLTVETSVAASIAASRARKLIMPRPAPGWEWVTGEKWHVAAAVREATEAIETIVSGDLSRTSAGPGMIILLIAATVLILILITSLLGSVIPIF